MPINGVVAHVRNPSFHPFDRDGSFRVVKVIFEEGISAGGRRLFPMKLRSDLRPKGLGVLDALPIHGFILGHGG